MLKDFNLAQTLDCGQCFRWQRSENGVWQGIVNGKQFVVQEGEEEALLQDAFLSHYFDLERDYPAIRRALVKTTPELEKASEFACGIRILNQDPWEALCSFIISQNNNIPRIKGIISRLCAACGEPFEQGVYDFPSAKSLAAATEEQLRALGTGFRAPYLLDAARKVAGRQVNLEQVRAMPLDEARETLMQIKGVGPKVADCALLYGLHRLDAFPADVWIKRAMATYFPGKSPEEFGPNAGIAQQYLFHYIRCAEQEAPVGESANAQAV